MKKLAIMTPGFLPVPAVKGGAIEQLIEYFINENEIKHKYLIDLYTVDDKLLNHKKYKYTNLIKIKNKQLFKKYRIFYGIKNRFFRFIGKEKIFSYVTDQMVKKYKINYYDKVLIENNMDLYLELLPKIKNEEIFFHLHNDFGSDDLSKSTSKTKVILETASRIIVVSKFLKNKLTILDPNKSNKISVVYNGIISNNLKQIGKNNLTSLKNKYNICQNDIVFTFVGRFSKDKGLDKLLEAMQLLHKVKYIKCLIVGKNLLNFKDNDKYIQILKEDVKKIGNNVIFTGYIKNNKINEIYSLSDCVVIPSQCDEAFGLVALEAMKMGLPVIATKSGGLDEILSINCAFLIKRDKNYVSNLKNYMLFLAKNSTIRQKMGKNGKSRANTFPKNEKEYFDLLSSKLN